MTFCTPILSTICGKLKDVILLGGLVDARFQSTSSSCKLSSELHSIFQHKNREDCHISVWDGLWEEEDNIVFDCDIPCVKICKDSVNNVF